MRQGKHDAASLRICTLAAGFTLTEEVIMTVLTIVIVIALSAMVGPLLWGIASMARGGEFDQHHSHQLMFARRVARRYIVVFTDRLVYCGEVTPKYSATPSHPRGEWILSGTKPRVKWRRYQIARLCRSALTLFHPK